MEVTGEISHLLGKSFHKKPIDFEAIEMAARRSVLAIDARVGESVLNADITDYALPG